MFQSISSRELKGFRVRKRPYLFDGTPEVTEIGSVAVEHFGEETPPLAMSFCKTEKFSHILAVSDENGHVSLFDSRRKFQSSASNRENTEKARVADWVAHQNAIFDVCWIKEDTSILTASGDQTIRVWDIQKRKCTSVLMGHVGSVKSLCSHPTNPDIVVSGSRDGSFAIWDLRRNFIPTTVPQKDYCIGSSSMVKGAHLLPQQKLVKRGRKARISQAASMSITSVLYLKDEVSVATSGAVDSIVKFWDTRNLKHQVTQTSPKPDSGTEKEKRLHGVSSLSQDSSGMFLSASCMDNRIYMYNVLQLEKGPVKSFSGSRIESFYVKAALSPDGNHILSGSSDGNAYVWQVNKPHEAPISLSSHDGEVTTVAWSPSETGTLATSSDDFTVRVWSIQDCFASCSRSPTAIRRRIMAVPTEERERLLMREDPKEVSKGGPKSREGEDSNPSSGQVERPQRVEVETSISTPPMMGTPEGQKKRFLLSFDTNEETKDQKTPEAALKSPSSVLNPPSSVKRTIRDYFVAPSS